MKTSIIIPVHNHWDYTEMCLRSIEKYTQDHEVIIIDNGSTHPLVYEELESVLSCPKLILHNKRNLGFPAACNMGAKVAEGDLLCFLNNDTIVTPDWLKHLRYFIEEDLLDVVGPITNNIYGDQVRQVETYNAQEELDKVAVDIYLNAMHQYKRLYRVIGFCLLVENEVWDAAGPFSEIYGLGNFEDDHFCLSAIEKGFRTGYALDTFIHHFGSVTCSDLGPAYKRLLEKNLEIFRSTWPKEKIDELIAKNGG